MDDGRNPSPGNPGGLTSASPGPAIVHGYPANARVDSVRRLHTEPSSRRSVNRTPPALRSVGLGRRPPRREGAPQTPQLGYALRSSRAVATKLRATAADACRPGAPHGASHARRRPEESALYDVVRAELESFLARARERDRCVPRFVERELRAYLGCGILAHG